MDKLWEALLPSIPAWMLWPIAVVGLVLFLWPRIQSILLDFVPSRRAYRRAKEALELQKLRYEIEAIKREHSIEDLGDELPEPLRRDLEAAEPEAPPTPAEPSPQGGPSSRAKTAISGALGGLLVAVLPFAQGGLEGLFDASGAYAAGVLVGVLVRAVLLMALGAVTVHVFRPSSLQQAFLLGAAPGLILQVAVGGVAPPVDSMQVS